MDSVVLVTVWLLIISISDLKKRRVSVWMLAVGGTLAAMEIWNSRNDYWAIFWGILPGILFLAIALGTKTVGYGDGIVLLFLGILSGIGRSLMVLGVALCMAAVCSLVLLVFKKVRRNTRIPFLPFLTVGWLLVIVF